jgi:hypothetical protein
MSLRATIPPHVVMRSFGDQTVVVNLQSSRYFGLDPVASRMVERLQEAGSIEEAVRLLVAEYDASADVIRRDLENLVAQLERCGILAGDARTDE